MKEIVQLLKAAVWFLFLITVMTLGLLVNSSITP